MIDFYEAPIHLILSLRRSIAGTTGQNCQLWLGLQQLLNSATIAAACYYCHFAFFFQYLAFRWWVIYYVNAGKGLHAGNRFYEEE